MIWSELIQYGQQFAPNADVYIVLDLPEHVCSVHYPVSEIVGDGSLVLIRGGHEHVEGGGRC